MANPNTEITEIETYRSPETTLAADKAKVVSDSIESLQPPDHELLMAWSDLVEHTNPNIDPVMFKYTVDNLLDKDLIKKYGVDTSDALEKVVEGSTKYQSYRLAAATTYDFFDKLINDSVASTDKIKYLAASFGSDSFPKNMSELAQALNITVEDLPDSSGTIYLNMNMVHVTLINAAKYGKDMPAARPVQPEMGPTVIEENYGSGNGDKDIETVEETGTWANVEEAGPPEESPVAPVEDNGVGGSQPYEQVPPNVPEQPDTADHSAASDQPVEKLDTVN